MAAACMPACVPVCARQTAALKGRLPFAPTSTKVKELHCRWREQEVMNWAAALLATLYLGRWRGQSERVRAEINGEGCGGWEVKGTQSYVTIAKSVT